MSCLGIKADLSILEIMLFQPHFHSVLSLYARQLLPIVPNICRHPCDPVSQRTVDSLSPRDFVYQQRAIYLCYTQRLCISAHGIVTNYQQMVIYTVALATTSIFAPSNAPMVSDSPWLTLLLTSVSSYVVHCEPFVNLLYTDGATLLLSLLLTGALCYDLHIYCLWTK
jgi:hypothetical protein